METVVGTKLNTIQTLYFIYLFMAAWGTDDFDKADGALNEMREQFSGMVKDGSLTWFLEDAKAAAEGMNPGLPAAWLHVIAPPAKLQNGPLPEDYRNNLNAILAEMDIMLVRLRAEEWRNSGSTGRDGYKTDKALNDTDRKILEALGDERMKGPALYKKSGVSEALIRQRMGVLKSLGYIESNRGYRRLK